ncbi:cytochrome C oxidase subunit IV family protein [Psychromarinibacter sp. C21-152]|uniref:Cytochrome C oxidase subunit IV family protein n=1 Tax=Psychromarinibacter sediminicola TaxID=3033385 RepID=A0AAE3TA00_9RHOB|nr:cytochrome C oxidase subunit IV family protein [Psychromarinibacter sediminicola]MDF0602752.1 cytochrome C oxidase subunit IV family protein [Psychromarinibacter sediminicola]
MTRHLITFGALAALLALTTWVAFLDLGAGNPVLALGIAAAKAALVAFGFMGLGRSAMQIRLTGAAALVWLAIFVGLTLWAGLSG